MTGIATSILAATVKTMIAVPPEPVFDYLSSLENNPQWNWSVTATTPLTPGPLEPGSKYTQTSAVEPDHPQVLEVTRLERPHLLEVEASGNRSTVTYRYALQPTGRQTRLTVRAQVRPRHPVGLPALYVQRLQASLLGNMGNLRRVLTSAESQNTRRNMANPPRLVLSYMGQDTYHRGAEGDDLRPGCQPTRIRGIATMRIDAERCGLRACPLCWASLSDSATPHGR